MPASLADCLADLNARIDPAQEEYVLEQWRRFVNDECDEPYFSPLRRKRAPSGVDWPDFHINDAIQDPDATILSQLAGVSGTLEAGGGDGLQIRCNYGTAIMPSVLGCEVYVMPREAGTLPTGVPLHDTDKVRALVDAGPADPRHGLGSITLNTAERMRELFADYPNLDRYIHIYHPDTQGTIDIAEMVWGAELFYAFYEQTDLMAELFEVVTETYIAFMREWFKIVPAAPAFSPHWGMYHRGPIMLRDDSLMNISSEMYVDFVRDHDQRVFDTFGGGAIHFCGRNDHFIEAMSEMDGLYAINLSQPEMNDLETIWRNTVDKGIQLIGFPREWAAKAVESGRDLLGRVHAWGGWD
jgi:hypothetical protein